MFFLFLLPSDVEVGVPESWRQAACPCRVLFQLQGTKRPRGSCFGIHRLEFRTAAGRGGGRVCVCVCARACVCLHVCIRPDMTYKIV